MTVIRAINVCLAIAALVPLGSALRKADAANAENFLSVLAAEKRSPDIPESEDLYGGLVGSWELDVRRNLVDVSDRGWKGEVHFGWVLEGRAVQDVWIVPRRSERNANLGKTNNMFGTTLRVWDAQLKAWRVTWINPVTGSRNELVGRRSGKDIVQLGLDDDGLPVRWTFTDITNDSFRWTGESVEADGKTWKLLGEFRAKRIR
jgi:hypothetical protein